jgi:beta-glucanase (GH16 family)
VKGSGTGVHSGMLWMMGGNVGSSGYPPVCTNILETMTDGNAFYNCSTNSNLSYEVDIAEIAPGDLGLLTNSNNLFTYQNGTATHAGGGTYNTGVDLSAAFHTYELIWNSTQLVFKFDGTTTTTITYSLAAPMFLIMDQEIDNHAPPSGSGAYPQVSQYDYVRVCSDPTATCNPGDATMIFEDEFNGGTHTSGVTMQGVTIQ